MFWPAKMLHATLVIPENNKEPLILALHEEGVCQLAESKTVFREKEAVEGAARVRDTELRLSDLINRLEPYKAIPQPENLIKKLFSPSSPEKTCVDLRSSDKILSEVEATLETLEAPLAEKLDSLEEKRDRINEIKHEISDLMLLPDIPTDWFKPNNILSVTLGAVTPASVPDLKKSLSKLPALCLTSEMNKEKTFIAVFFPPEKDKEVNQVLHETGLELLDIPFKKQTPREQIDTLQKEWKDLTKQGRDTKNDLRAACKKHFHSLELLLEEVQICKQRTDALENLGGGKSFSILEGWVPASDEEKFKKVVSENSDTHYLELEERKDAPTVLNNPGVVKPFELLTELYSMPRYGRLDPTPIMALTYAIFFGFMLTDAVYGIVVVLLAYGIYRGMGKYNPGIRRFCALLVIAGIATAILGALLGSYLGDLPQRLGYNVPMLLDPMKDILVLVAITAGIGILHLTLGLILGVIDRVKNKEYYQAVSDQGVWLIFVSGLLLAIGSMLMEALLMPAVGLILLSVVLRMAFVFKDDGPVSSVLSVFNFSGFIGDVFSYTRLMALAVGTAGIALAINFMAIMVTDLIPYVGIVIALVILLIGHVFNMGMNGLGAFVHGLRLHFLEFFTKFYDGGGTPYKPFYATRKITEIKR